MGTAGAGSGNLGAKFNKDVKYKAMGADDQCDTEEI